MKAVLTYTILLALCLIFEGCPYESNVPISEASIKINPILLGTWGDPEHKNEFYKVTQFDDYTYKILKTKNESDETEEYFAYSSLVSETTFLNLWVNDKAEPKHNFVLYKIDLKNENILNLVEVTENIDEKFMKSEDLYGFINANMNNSYFFNKEELELRRSGK